jgi:hypothetical protein
MQYSETLCSSFLLAVTIYVKKEEEKVYNALMLDSFGVVDLREAVSNDAI